VAQFLLDDALSHARGAACSLVCTQPRRLAAIGVAERCVVCVCVHACVRAFVLVLTMRRCSVASERGEACGATVGYAIRLERKVCA
jgi:ATP-dependent RNA helicase DHX57